MNAVNSTLSASRQSTVTAGQLPASAPSASRGLLPPAVGILASGYCKPPRLQPIDLVLDANEGVSVPPDVLADMAAKAVVETAVRTYPSTQRLRALLAEREGVPAEQLIVAAGADDALNRLVAAALGPVPGSAAVLTTPTFEMIPRYIALFHGAAREIPWLEGALPLAELQRAIVGDASTPPARLVVVVTPNNPTGAEASIAELEAVLAMCRTAGAVLCLDQAYAEFGDNDLTARFAREPGVVITRTLSKAWGLAGLRVGYAIGDPEILSRMIAVGQPYAAAGPSLGIAEQWLQCGEGTVRQFVRTVKHERASITEMLRGLGLHLVESRANFVLVTLTDKPGRAVGSRAALVADMLASVGISVRCFSKPILLDKLRITLPGEAGQFARLCAALRQVLAPGGALPVACTTREAAAAARAEGWVSIGVLGADAAGGVEGLLRAGAARVVSSSAELAALASEAAQ